MNRRKRSFIVLGIYAILFIVGALGLPRLSFYYDFQSFFPNDDPDLEKYIEFRKNFEPDDNFILIAIENRPTVFEYPFISDVHDFTIKARSLPHITSAECLTTLEKPISALGSFQSGKHLYLNGNEISERRIERIMEDPFIPDRFVSRNKESLIVFLKTGDLLSQKQADEVNGAMKDLIKEFKFKEFHIAGLAHYQSEFVENQKNEFILYSLISMVLIFVTIVIIYRNSRLILIATSSVFMALFLFICFLAWKGKPLDPTNTLFPILIIIVGISDVVHILSKYTQELRKGSEPWIAIKATFREVGLATLLTSLTTAIGFTSLITSNVPPVQNFGITASIGVLMTFVFVLFFTTSLLIILTPKKILTQKLEGRGWVPGFLSFVERVTFHQPNKVVILFSIVLVISIFGISKISTNIHIVEQFPRANKIKSDFLFIENNLGGVRSFECGIEVDSGFKITDPNIIRQIARIEDFLIKETPVKGIVSPASAYRYMHMAANGGDAKYYTIPEDDSELMAYIQATDLIEDERFNLVLSKDKKFGRITGKMIDIGSDSSQLLKQKIDRFLAEINTSELSLFPTGTAHLLDKNYVSIRQNMLEGLAGAFILISLIMAVLFKNLKMVLVSLIPNVFPLIFCGGLMGFLGIEPEPATMVIFAIAYGIAVDDTIHFLSKYRIEIFKGVSRDQAIINTIQETGRAIIYTSLILFFGFGILVTSFYPPTMAIGLLVGITLIIALLSDILLLPVLIRWFFPKNGLKTS